MFKKVLVANRGEVAVRIIRACRDLGIEAVAIYDLADRASLHVRLADQCVPLRTEQSYGDADEVLRIAREVGAEAIHPGYGFLAERPAFIRACEAAGIVFIGPPSDVVATIQNKIDMLETVRAAGYVTARYSAACMASDDPATLTEEAERIGYPLVVKSCSGGRGPGTRLVREPDQLVDMVRRARAEMQAVFGDPYIYFEQAILPSRYLAVQLLADNNGQMIHFGERDGSIQRNNRKVLEETPAPYLTPEQRTKLWQTALAIAKLFNLRSACSVEFLVDDQGNFYFADIKPRLQVEHPISEMVAGIDIVREQLHIGAGEPRAYRQEDVQLDRWAMQCHINAEDPWNDFLPSPGRLRRFRLPGGPGVRVETYAYAGLDIPVQFDRLLAKVIVWGNTREECLQRMRRTLEDFAIGGVQTNLPLVQRLLELPEFERGEYTTELARHRLENAAEPLHLRDLAVSAAVAYIGRNRAFRPTTPERRLSGWHRNSRQLPE